MYSAYVIEKYAICLCNQILNTHSGYFFSIYSSTYSEYEFKLFITRLIGSAKTSRVMESSQHRLRASVLKKGPNICRTL